MTGPEHYKEAENLLGQAASHGYGDSDCTADLIAAAQVHATLAASAANALAFTAHDNGNIAHWARATGVR